MVPAGATRRMIRYRSTFAPARHVTVNRPFSHTLVNGVTNPGARFSSRVQVAMVLVPVSPWAFSVRRPHWVVVPSATSNRPRVFCPP
ncbi:hypothetical protein ACFFX0_03120 [Citricoccus parietis]|uniref:Uncharacterized protein n=1 Tax=Citricoccus parietis TaxID=592307 RepID=A0ABV5FU77_9MICC